MNRTSIILATIAVAGTLLAALITQLTELRRMRKQHGLELIDERARWTRDRRADLYIQITRLYREAQTALDEGISAAAESESIKEKMEALVAQVQLLKARVPAATVAERQKILDSLKECELESQGLQASNEQLAADVNDHKARFIDINNRLNDQRIALEVLGSQMVKRLATETMVEINKAGDVFAGTAKPGDYDSKTLYEKWSQLNNAMRKEVGIVD